MVDRNYVTSFRRSVTVPLQIRLKSGSTRNAMLKEGFAIRMMLDPRIPASDIYRFQYRQYIRGTISVQEGRWQGDFDRGMNWLRI